MWLAMNLRGNRSVYRITFGSTFDRTTPTSWASLLHYLSPGVLNHIGNVSSQFHALLSSNILFANAERKLSNRDCAHPLAPVTKTFSRSVQGEAISELVSET